MLLLTNLCVTYSIIGVMMNKILAIDDDEEILKLIKTALEIENYQVTTLQEIQVPIDFDKFKGYDLILLDILMPNIIGILL